MDYVYTDMDTTPSIGLNWSKIIRANDTRGQEAVARQA